MILQALTKFLWQGTLASNTFSRTSDFQGGFSSSHFHSFELLTPEKHLRCAPDAEDDDEKECYKLIPGAMGIAGVIVAVELDLKVIDSDTVVHTRVLEHVRGVNKIADRFFARALDNRQKREWDLGFYVIVHEERDEPYAIFMGSKTGRKTEVYKPPVVSYDLLAGGKVLGNLHAECQLYEDTDYSCTAGLELYEHDLVHKSRLIRASRRTTPYMINKFFRKYFWGAEPGIEFSAPDWVKKYKLFEGAKFTNDFYDYTYYHNGYWEAHGGSVKEELPNMHQAWVMDVRFLEGFMDTALKICCEITPGIRGMLWAISFLKISHRFLITIAPCFHQNNRKKYGMNVVYQITVALDDGNDPDLIRHSTAFYEELSEKVQAYASVYLLKEAHASNRTLRRQYAGGIARVKAFCEKFDPGRLFSSALWERLMPDGHRHH